MKMWDSKFLNRQEAKMLGTNYKEISYAPFAELNHRDQQQAVSMYPHKAGDYGAKYPFVDEHYYYPVDASGALYRGGRRAQRVLAIPYKMIQDEEYMKSLGYEVSPKWKASSKTAARGKLTEQGMELIKLLSHLLKQNGWEAGHLDVNEALRRERFDWIKRFVNPQQDMSNFEDSWNEMGDYRRKQVAVKYGVNFSDPNVKNLVYEATQMEFQKEKKKAWAEAGMADSLVYRIIGADLGYATPNADNMMYTLRVSNMIMTFASEASMDKKMVAAELLKVAKDLTALNSDKKAAAGRFENAVRVLQDCLENWDVGDNEDEDTDKGTLVNICKKIGRKYPFASEKVAVLNQVSVEKLMAYEDGSLDEDETVELFQQLIDTGMAWQLQGAYGRMAHHLIQQGLCHR